MTGGLFAVGISAALVAGTQPLSAADPNGAGDSSAPSSASDAVTRLTQLSHQSDVLNQQALTAQEALDKALAAQRDADKRLADDQGAVDYAQAQIAKYQPVVDRVVSAMYQGARTGSMFAVLGSDRPQQLLDQMSLLQFLGNRTAMEIDGLVKAMDSVKAGQDAAARSAAAARTAARNADAQRADVRKKQAELASSIAQVSAAFGQLSGKDREAYIGTLSSPGFNSDALLASLPKDSRAGALAAAFTRIGDPYVWGATGPDAFDCSGLVQWAYHQVGINLPRTSEEQAEGGTPVDINDLQPGDVITFYSDASHVGLYVGNGQILHASTFGVPVQVMPLSHGGPIHNARRY
jgi:cell wall-associated NlpC family hydrolase